MMRQHLMLARQARNVANTIGSMMEIYVMFLLLLHGRRRHQVQNQTRRILDTGVHRPYPFQ